MSLTTACVRQFLQIGSNDDLLGHPGLPMMKPPSLGWFMSVGGRLHSGKNPPTNKSLIVNNLTCPFSDKHVRKLLRHLRVVEAGYHTAAVDNCGVAVRVRPEAVVCHCCKCVYCCGLPLW